MIVNLNQQVKVKFTEEGKRILCNYFKDFRIGTYEEYITGKKLFQLWELMQIFGYHVYNGCKIPFVDNVIDIQDGL